MEIQNLSNQPNPVNPKDVGEIAAPDTSQMAAARERAFERLYQLRVANRLEREQARELGRRDFFRTATLGVVALTGLGATARTMIKETAKPENSKLPANGGSVPTLFAVDLAGRYAWENILFQVGQWAFAVLSHEHKLPVGNASMSSGALRRVDIERAVSAFEKDPECATRLYMTVGVVGPIAEEAIFRVLPSLFTSSPGARWDVGIPFNLIFSLMHSVVPDGAQTNISIPLSSTHKLSLDKLPISQFFLGAFCWYCARTYGSLAPILTHTLNNQIPAIVLAWGGKETFNTFLRLVSEELEQADKV
jgi:hypothetical protein